MPIVLTVGSLHYDIMVQAEHLPRKDETAIGSRWFPKFGGKGGNQAIAAAKAGADSRMIGAVGDDDFGRFLRRNLAIGRVDDRFIATIAATGSGMSVAIQDASGDYAATIVSGANLTIERESLTLAEVWSDVRILVLQNEVPEAINLIAAVEAQRRGTMVLLNAAPARLLAPELEALVGVLVVNSVEAEMMGTSAVTDLASAARAAEVLAQRFAVVIVTAGAMGLAAAGKDGHFTTPARKVKAISSHGAGDCFVGALAAALARGEPLPAGCAAASNAAADHVAGKHSD